MSSSVADSSSRTWWFSAKFLNPSKSAKDRRRSLSEKPPKPPKPSNTFKFNTFTSALGFKPKKHPSLAIQDPPPVPVYPVQPPKPPQVRQPTTFYTNRPPSNSVSSTLRSSLEPRTPSDAPREPLPFRHSLLTLSDSDPFASHGLSPTTMPSKHSRKSDTPTSERISRQFTTLFLSDSYTPAFSQSATEIRTARPSESWKSEYSTAPAPNISINKGSVQDELVLMTPADSTNSVRAADNVGQEAGNVNQEATPQPRIRTLSKSGSSSTLTDNKRVPNSTPSALLSRARSTVDVRNNHYSPPSRDGPKPHKSISLVTLSSSGATIPSIRPHIVRQMSASRLGKPPFAPPAHHLPPPPVDNASAEGTSSLIIPASVTTPSSSIVSFASSLYPDNDDPFLHVFGSPSEVKEESNTPIRNLPATRKESKDSHKGLLPKASASTSLLPPADIGALSRTLKKASSHQSFSSKRGSTSSISTPLEEGSDKHPRKQRSFPHPRLHQSHRNPVPQNSPNFASFAAHMDPNEIAEKRRGSTGGASTPSRKRLFSATSLRRSTTSQGEQHEADVRSVLSLPLESECTQSTFSPNVVSSTASSSRDSVGDEPAPVGSPEYIPQQIMSPAEMLRVEASIEAGMDDYLIKRKRSVPSVSTLPTYPSDMFSDYSFPGTLSPSPPPVEQPAVVSHSGKKGHTSRRSLSMKSNERSSPCVSPRPSTSHMYMTPPTSPTTSSLLLLPASPERKPVSLPPPPRARYPRPPTHISQLNRLSIVPLVPLSPPPARKSLRSKPSLESVVLRRSIMRKPSFLEIEDDLDKDGDRRLDDSFLDMNRESFDTIRSMPGPHGLFEDPSVS